MFRYIKHASLLLFTLIMASTTVLAGNGTDADKSVDDNRKVIVKQYKWFGDSPKAKRIRVINPFGSITSRTTTYGTVELSGAIQKIGENPGIHHIEVKDNKGVTEVIVTYPNGIRNDKGQLTGRFDLGVWVPSWVTLEFETDFGDIKVSKSASNVIARSNSGKIKVGTMGSIEASSNSGNIHVDLYAEKFKDDFNVNSDSGDISVKLSQHAKINLAATASEAVTHNFAEYSAISVAEKPFNLVANMAANSNKAKQLKLTTKKGAVDIFVAAKPSHKVKLTPVKVLAQK